ncbi:MAG: FemAB family PEP-CTERM system-associated protein [candidate division Zixibacteria bacterium]|nr:FemAB family PEP-CTERM system-associated protein [candidate division Zixibacteria bacterium]
MTERSPHPLKTDEKMSDTSNINIKLADQSDIEKWDNYLEKSSNKTFAHRWGWSEVLKNSFGVKPYYFIAGENGEVRGILPTTLMKSMLFGKFLISLPWLDYGGPVADNEEIALKLVDSADKLARDNDCEFFEMRAVRHRLADMTEKTDKREFIIDLSGGEETVWKSFDAKARNQVRKAEKANLTVEFGGVEMLGEFYKVFACNMRDLGTPVWPSSLFTEIFRNFPGDAEFALVKLDGNAIAGGLLLHYGDYSGVPSASAYRHYLNLCPNNILYWEIIKRCIQRGSTVFDFGRSSENAGTYRFKKQWSKKSVEPREQVWQYRLFKIDNLPELNPNNPKFKLAINIWRRLPLPIANFLGPKIVTKLP